MKRKKAKVNIVIVLTVVCSYTTINGKTLHFVFSFHAQGFKSGCGH